MSKKTSNKSARDDFEGLSLTGSHVGTPVSSARTRPGSSSGSARSSAKPVSSATAKNRAKPSMTVNNSGDSSKHRNQNIGGAMSNRSDVSTISASSRNQREQTPRDDFLALFDNSSSASQGKGARAKQKPKPAWMNSARSTHSVDSEGDRLSGSKAGSKFSHSIFQPTSARSTSTVDDEDQEYHNLNLNLSTYSNKSVHKSPAGGGTKSPRDYNNAKSNYHNSARDSSRELERVSNGTFTKPRTDGANHLGDSFGRTYAMPVHNNELTEEHHEVTSQKATKLNSIANNMTSQAFSGGTKAPLQNSYQNIKHKTPVNEVRHLPQQQQQQQLQQQNNQVDRNVAEDYIKKCNMSACIIQRWYRRHASKNYGNSAGKAAMKRLMDSKRQQKQQELQQERDNERNKGDERKRQREDRARQARLSAIEELQKKREEKRHDNKRIAKEEISFLQDSGKVTKAPANKSNIKKKVVSKSRQRDRTFGKDSDSDSDNANHNGSETHRKVDDLFQSRNMCSLSLKSDSDKDNRDKPTSPLLNNESHPYSLSREPPQGAAASGGEGGNDDDATVTPSQANTKTTLDDLMETLKKLESDEKLASARKDKNEKPLSWLDDLEKDASDHDNSRSEEFLTTTQLEKLNPSKDNIRKSGLLTDEKLNSIMTYLDEVDMAERLSEIDHELQKTNHALERPAPLVPSSEEILELEQASAMAAEVTSTMLSQKMELDDKKRSVAMLQKALSQQRELTVRHAKETEREMKKRLSVQKDEYEGTIKRHLSFIDQLIDDKKTLTEKCEKLVQELKTVDRKYQDKIKQINERNDIEVKKMKDVTATAEKLRREKWIDEKTKKIKEMTVKGLEPEIQRLIAKHKAEVKKLKSIHEAELLASDERAGGRYVKMTEELRDQLANEKESACARERELAKQTYEKQLSQEEEAYQSQRRRLYAEVQEEKDRVASQASRQRAELDRLQRQLEDAHSSAVSATRTEYERARDEQERRHQSEIQQYKDQLSADKAAWEESYMKQKEAWLLARERELKESVRRERDNEIEMVIRRLEEDNQGSRDECQRVADNRVKRIRDKYEAEILELERTEKSMTERYNQAKAELIEVSGECERSKVTLKQKDREIAEVKRLLDKHNDERDVVSDVIRQEFADRIVATEEENRRLKNAASELKARHKVEVERARADVELAERAKEEEMEQVHSRVKAAILKKEEVMSQLRQQHEAALKRADHLEGLLEQQRKQLLALGGKKS